MIQSGLSVIPPQSRVAREVRLALKIAESERDTERAYDRLYEAYGDLRWVHVFNNAALVALGLRAGGSDFGRTVCLTVAGGWDTDFNGATVGGVVGALIGARKLPPRWVQPLQNRIASSLRGFHGAAFDDLAHRTAAITLARG